MNVINNIKKALCSDFIELDFLPSGGKETGACPADRQTVYTWTQVCGPASCDRAEERQAWVRQTGRSLFPPPHDRNSDICTLHLDPINTTRQSDLIKNIVATLAITQLIRIRLLWKNIYDNISGDFSVISHTASEQTMLFRSAAVNSLWLICQEHSWTLHKPKNEPQITCKRLSLPPRNIGCERHRVHLPTS